MCCLGSRIVNPLKGTCAARNYVVVHILFYFDLIPYVITYTSFYVLTRYFNAGDDKADGNVAGQQKSSSVDGDR